MGEAEVSKMPITYQQETKIPKQDLLDLYNDAGWGAYTAQPEVLVKAVENSLYVLTARDGGKLVGLIRIVGDGQTITYIQDILVLKAYKRKGIGKTLMQRALEEFKHVRQKVLLTDDNPETRGFYQALGFQSCDKGELVAFVRMTQSP